MIDALANELISADIRALANWVVGQGYTVERAIFPGYFRDYLLKLRKGDLYVELCSDRDLVTVAVGLSESLPPLLVDLWHACVRQEDGPTSLPTLAREIRLLREDLQQIEAEVRKNRGALVACVRGLQDARIADSWRLAREDRI